MDELFSTIGLVSAIIGGFAFTFIGALLTTESTSSVFKWVFGLSMFSSFSLMSAALGSVLTSLAAKHSYEINLELMHQKISILFLCGILSLISAISLSGWLRSRQLGYVSIGVGALSVVMMGLVISPYLIFA